MSPRIVELPKIIDVRGNLSFIQNSLVFPHEIKRVFWTYNVRSGETRGGHAYHTQTELIIALSGSVDVVLFDKRGNTKTVFLNQPNFGLIIPPNNWRHMENFSSNAIILHISNAHYVMADYILTKNEFVDEAI